MPADRLFHPRLGHSIKVASLSHLEFRVWSQYILSSDDFGVMMLSALRVQADNTALAREPHEVVQACLERLVSIGLLAKFQHQSEIFLCQLDWQDFQKVEYPRVSFQPKPSAEVLKTCTVKTRRLFGKHPGGSPKRFPKVSQRSPEGSPTNARAQARGTANGLRLTANGRGEPEGSGGEFTKDELKHARDVRTRVRGGCQHDPRCGSVTGCVRLVAAEIRARAS